LQSLFQHVKEFDRIFILGHLDTFEKIRHQYSNLHFIDIAKQGYKEGLMEVLKQVTSPFFVIMQDNVVVKETVAINECIQCLKKSGGNGFYFRIGKNEHSIKKTGPPYQFVGNKIYAWKIKTDLSGIWGYPDLLEMCLYEKKAFENEIINLSFSNLSELISERGKLLDMHSRIGLCYDQAKIFILEN
jgi:hypothetical protein